MLRKAVVSRTYKHKYNQCFYKHETMNYSYAFSNKKFWKCIVIIAVLIVAFHFTVICHDIFKQNRIKVMPIEIEKLINNTSILTPTLQKMSDAVQTLQREKKKICHQVRLTLPRSRHFLVNHEHKLLYCWIHKVASTSWIAFFSHLANRTHIDEYYREIGILSPKSEELPGLIKRKDYYKFLVVRHPFQRLVSAYRDRIQDTSRFTSQAWIYVPRIFSLSRPFLNRSQIFNIDHHQYKLSIIPTFQEFVHWLLLTSPEKYDVHWNRYSDHCGICSINYDTVIKMDNFKQEKQLSVIRQMGLSHLNISLLHFQRTSSGPTDFDVSCQYFHQLFPEQAKALYTIYKMDFDIFHYSAEPYIKCAQNKSLTDLSAQNATIRLSLPHH